MPRIALCVGVKGELCQLVYGGKELMDGVERRETFEGAEVGRWFRVGMDKGRKGKITFTAFGGGQGQNCAPPTRIISRDTETVDVIQVFDVWMECLDRIGKGGSD